MSSRNKKKKKFADYVLYQEPGVPVAVVEAKDNHHTVGHGMQQALGYAEILQVPSAFSSRITNRQPSYENLDDRDEIYEEGPFDYLFSDNSGD